jgi:outer membrane immunogenic protein
MKIKLLVAAAATVVISSAMAQSAFEGAYGQLGVGYESVNPSFSNGTVTSGDATGTGYTVSSSNGNSFIGNVGIGAYFPVDKTFLLGVGAEYSPFAGSSTNYTISLPAYSYSETGSWKKKNSYNIFLSPAIAIDKDKLAYAKVGYTGMSTQSTAADGTQNTTNYTGYSLGLGYKQMVSGSIYAFGEVNYAAYGSKSIGSDVSGTAKPTTMNALVGVGYKF